MTTILQSTLRGLPVHEIGGHRYIAGEPKIAVTDDVPRCVTVFSTRDSYTGRDESNITVFWVERILREYAEDDVFNDGFLQGVVFTASDPSSIDIAPPARELLENRGAVWIKTLPYSSTLEPGPHLAVDGHLAPALRLYDDTHGAFLHTFRPGPDGKFLELEIGGASSLATPAVAVPSRVGRSATKELPLRPFRIAVKDIFEIEDVRISVCNKAYYELYGPAKKTAAAIQLLIDAGARIVGTTKLASFAATEEPIECIDYEAPWNPRADGYQSPAGSSSGSGAAMAAYEWLDITIGSDTSGSGRRPAHWNGCFGMRPTHGLLPHEGYVKSFEQFDVPTFYTRTLELVQWMVKGWYGQHLEEPGDKLEPPTIIYPIDYMSLISNQAQLDVIDGFVADLEEAFHIKHQRLSFNELWASTTPPAAKGLSLQEYMKDACRNSFFHDDYHNFDQFRQDYHAKFGKQPYVSPPVRWQWDLSSRITTEERDEAVARLEVYRQWFSEHVMQVGKRDTIVLIPIEEISPRYRDEPLGRYFNPVGVPMLFLSPILGAPELTVPIGHSPYQSKVTGNQELLPVGISLMGAPGYDLSLVHVALNALVSSNRPIKVKAGKDMF